MPDVFLDNDIEEIMYSLSDDFLLRNVISQINNIDIDNTENYLDIFNSRYDYVIEKYNEENEIVSQLREIKYDFYMDIFNELTKHFLMCSLRPETDGNKFYQLIYNVYVFFILRHKENLVDFYVNYIFENKNNLIVEYKSKVNKKDLEIMSLKKIVNNINNAVLITALEDIIEGIQLDNFNDYFLTLKLITKNELDEEVNFNICNMFINYPDEVILKNTFHKRFNSIMYEESFRNVVLNDIKQELIKLLTD